jgi:hypothetical protein
LVKKWWKPLIAIAPTATVQAVFTMLGWFKMEPLPEWGMQINSVTAITFLVSAASAAVGYLLFNAKSNGTKALFILLDAFLLVGAFCVFTHLSHTPPLYHYADLTEAATVLSFFGTYMFYGLLVAFVVKVFWP